MNTSALKIGQGLFIGLFLFCLPLFSLAALPSSQSSGLPPSQSSGAPPSASQYSVQNPLKAKSIPQFIEQVLEAAIIIGIPVAVLFIVFAGFKFVIAVGNPKSIDDAKNNLLYTVIGIGIFLGAWIIAKIIFNTVNSLGG